eukprot:6191373-Pleurochrysis_carterae.AAC.2
MENRTAGAGCQEGGVIHLRLMHELEGRVVVGKLVDVEEGGAELRARHTKSTSAFVKRSRSESV